MINKVVAMYSYNYNFCFCIIEHSSIFDEDQKDLILCEDCIINICIFKYCTRWNIDVKDLEMERTSNDNVDIYTTYRDHRINYFFTIKLMSPTNYYYL